MEFKCNNRLLALSSLILGLLASGALTLAVAVDYWLHMSEPLNGDEYTPKEPGAQVLPPMTVKVHAGLWRTCIISVIDTAINGTLEEDPLPICSTIGYNQPERVTGTDTTFAILRAIRKASPPILIGLMLLLIALGLCTYGNSKEDQKTFGGAVVYIFSALILALGIILYIAGVNDEVAHARKKTPSNPDDPGFTYSYGWAFCFAGAAFLLSLSAAVTNITLYLSRNSKLEDMAVIIPGIEKRENFMGSNGYSNDESHYDSGSHNPTVIL